MSLRTLGTTRGSVALAIALAFVALTLLSLPAFADSQARIVRLSDIQGDVQIDRSIGQGLEKAFLNTPITQGMKLRTGEDGRAEVELEDGTVLHIVPNTSLEFSQLSLRDSGAKVSTVNLEAGTLYVNYKGKDSDEFKLNFVRESTRLAGPVHFRLQLNETDASVAVFHGNLAVTGPSGTVAVDKKQSATFDLTNDDAYTIARNIDEDPYDDWDKDQNQYHDKYYASNSARSNSLGYGYGVSDLNYYGSFYNMPGYGYMWQPYFAGVGWDPYGYGSWMWNPWGYSYVSGYPWGWAPYQYGSWIYFPGQGWFWQPGPPIRWRPVPPVINAPHGYVPPRPPTTGRTTVGIGSGPVAGVGNHLHKLTIAQGSAGLGIPRGGVNDLGKVSARVAQHGSATVHPTMPASTFEMGSTNRGSWNSGATQGGGFGAHSPAPTHSSPGIHGTSGGSTHTPGKH